MARTKIIRKNHIKNMSIKRIYAGEYIKFLLKKNSLKIKFHEKKKIGNIEMKLTTRKKILE